MKASILTGALLATIGSAALADEAWVSNAGTVIYLEDQGETAVLQQFHPRYGELRVYVRGLGGNYSNRNGVFPGYWIAVSPGQAGWTCDVSVQMEDGRTSNVWGRVELTFTTGGFPTGFRGATGSCHAQPDVSWSGEPS